MRKRTIGKILFVIMMLGSLSVYAADKSYSLNFSLMPQNSGYTSAVNKSTTSDSATVMQTNTNLNGYVIEVRVCDLEWNPKSSISTISGVETGYPSYSGYDVKSRDGLVLRITNPARNGASLSPECTWIP